MKSNDADAGRVRRWLPLAGRVVLALLLVALLIWAGLFTRVFLWLPWSAQKEANTGLHAAMADLPPLVDADAEALDPEFGEPVVTKRFVDCRVYPADRGWFVADHKQNCHLWEIEHRVVPEDAASPVDAAAEQLQQVDAWAEAEGMTPRERETCTLVAESAAPASEQIPVWSKEVRLFAVVSTGPDGFRECVPTPGKGIRDLDAVIVDDPNADRTDAAVPADAQQLVIVRQVWISNSSLGCLPLPVFCEPATTDVRPPSFD